MVPSGPIAGIAVLPRCRMSPVTPATHNVTPDLTRISHQGHGLRGAVGPSGQESLAAHRAPARGEQLCPADYTLVRAKIELAFAGQSWVRGLSSFRADTKRLWRGLSAEPLRQLSR